MIAYLLIDNCANVDTLNSEAEKENWTRIGTSSDGNSIIEYNLLSGQKSPDAAHAAIWIAKDCHILSVLSRR